MTIIPCLESKAHRLTYCKRYYINTPRGVVGHNGHPIQVIQPVNDGECVLNTVEYVPLPFRAHDPRIFSSRSYKKARAFADRTGGGQIEHELVLNARHLDDTKPRKLTVLPLRVLKKKREPKAEPSLKGRTKKKQARDETRLREFISKKKKAA